MPGLYPGRPGGEYDEPLLDMILERRPIPPGAPPEIHGLARMLAAVTGSAEPGDLPGQATALAAFTRLASPPSTSHAALRSARRSLSKRPARGRLPLAVALAAAAAGLGSTAAAYADVLPSPIQHFAHVAIGAPAPHRGFIRLAPAVSSPTHGDPELSPPAPAKRNSAAFSDPVSDKTRPGSLHNHRGAAPGHYKCVPVSATAQNHGRAVGHSKNLLVPSPAPNQVTSGSAHVLPGALALPSPTTACPDGTIPMKAAHARRQ